MRTRSFSTDTPTCFGSDGPSSGCWVTEYQYFNNYLSKVQWLYINVKWGHMYYTTRSDGNPTFSWNLVSAWSVNSLPLNYRQIHAARFISCKRKTKLRHALIFHAMRNERLKSCKRGGGGGGNYDVDGRRFLSTSYLLVRIFKGLILFVK
jgi:hypothetical protein